MAGRHLTGEDLGYVSIMQFSPRADGVTDDSAVLQQAVDYCANNNKTLVLPNITLCANNVSVSGKPLKIIAPNGAKLIQNGNNPIITFTGGFNAIYSVTAINTVSYSFYGDNAVTVTALTLASASHGYKTGDVVKLASDDPIFGAKPNGTTDFSGPFQRRQGEFLIVGGVDPVDAKIVYLTSTLRDTYTTNPRVARLTDNPFEISGVTFDVQAAGDVAGWNKAHLRVNASKLPKFVGLTCLQGYAAFLDIAGCYRYLVDKCMVSNLRNEPSNNRYGYGVNDISSEYGAVNNSHFINCRHGYTTNTDPVGINASSDFYRFGASANNIISNSHAHGCNNTGFDVHDEGYNIRFVGCTVTNDFVARSASGAGFSARGKHITFDSCTAIRCVIGFHIFEEYPNSTRNIFLDNCKAVDTNGAGLEIVNLTPNGIKVDGVRINGGYFESRRGTRVVRFKNAYNVEIVGTKFVSKNTDNSSAIFYVEASQVTVSNIDANMDAMSGTNPRFVHMLGATTFKAFRPRVFVGSAAAPNFLLYGDNTTTPQADIMDLDTDKALSRIGNGTVANYRLATYGKTSISNHIFTTITADEQFPDITNVADDVIFVRVQSTTGSFILAPPAVGYKPGQILVIRNTGSGEGMSLALRNGGTYNTTLSTGATCYLYNDQTITLVNITGVWTEVARDANTVHRAPNNTLPAASETYRGRIFTVISFGASDDKCYICLKKADGAYYWRELTLV